MCSRRAADEHIRKGDVKINGQAAKLGDFLDPKIDKVSLSGKEVGGNQSKLEYFAFNKPEGVVTTKSDELKRKSIADYIPQGKNLNPVGRLDMESEGLIILTNDGELIQRLTHPSFEHEKEYYVEAYMSENFKLSDLSRITKGLKIGGAKMKAKSISKIKVESKHNLVKFNLILTTGYNRQIRRMCDKIGLSVSKIMRIRIEKLDISSLDINSGQLKQIRKSDII